MILNTNEISRIYETMKLLKEKANIKDIDYNNALNKLETLVNCNTNIVCTKKKYCKSLEDVILRKGYSDLSEEARNFITRRIEEGYKNTYHSLMSVLGYKIYYCSKKEELEENKKLIYKRYIEKYKIKESDIKEFDEIYEICFERVLSKLI